MRPSSSYSILTAARDVKDGLLDCMVPAHDYVVDTRGFGDWWERYTYLIRFEELRNLDRQLEDESKVQWDYKAGTEDLADNVDTIDGGTEAVMMITW